MSKNRVKWRFSPHWSKQPCGFCPYAVIGGSGLLRAQLEGLVEALGLEK